MLSPTRFSFLKPFLPRRLQILLRRALINLYLPSCKDTWPIDPRSAKSPEGWAGWPEGKKFALVLTHDVETKKGLENCRALMDLEEKHGFRSSFNFVAGDYPFPKELLNEIAARGFEAGMHGLHHRGNIFRSRKVFEKQATKINQHLKKFNFTGFRSPSMYHNLEWLHELNITYDSSTFDTDPFEPQPDGVGTIFPFWVSGNSNQTGYVELPYTLPQDFLLFVLMRQKNIDIWEKKLDWIAENCGMALFITHPDYMNFNSDSHYEKYPVQYYEDFLTHIKTKYTGQYWNALSRDTAGFWAKNYRSNDVIKYGKAKKRVLKKVWIDLENTPHIPFFKPIIAALNKRGHECCISARDAYQVIDMADRFGFKYEKIGHHYGKSKILKVLGTFIRSTELLPFIVRNKPDLAVSHGSRTQLVASSLLGIPSLTLFDYEYTQSLVVINPTYVMMPDVIPTASVKMPHERVSQYPGIKEDVYVVSYEPNASIINELKIDEQKIVITIRPPATEAHYFCEASEELFEASMKYLLQNEKIQLILLPRNKNQEEFIRETWPQTVESGKIIIPNHAVNGLDLMWFSDLVISGGGTMNREAAALGVPVYSIFRGTIGAVDHYLSQQGRLILLEKPADLESKIKLVKRNKNRALKHGNKAALNAIVDKIEAILRTRS